MLHFIEDLDLDILNVAVDIDNDSNSYSCFGCTHSDSEQSKKETFQLSREEETVEYGEVDVYRVQDQFHADKHGQQVPSGEESVDAYEHHKGGNHQI